MTIREVKELLQEIIDLVGDTDREVKEYVQELKRSL